MTEACYIVLVRGFGGGDLVSERVRAFAEDLNPATYVVGTGSADSELEGAEFRSVDLHYEGHSQFAWTSLLNNELERCVREIARSQEVGMLVANDWSTATAARVMSDAEDIPFSVWLHSTEHTRGFMDDHSEQIHSVEKKECQAARHVLVSDPETRNSAVQDLGIAESKILNRRSASDFAEALNERGGGDMGVSTCEEWRSCGALQRSFGGAGLEVGSATRSYLRSGRQTRAQRSRYTPSWYGSSAG